MKNTNDRYITIGKIGSSFGVHGYLKVRAYTEFGANILTYKPWYLATQPDDTWQMIAVEESRLQSNNIIVKFTGINSPEEARLLTGKLIGIKRSQLPKLKENEYYWSDLIGLTVINKDGAIYGKVTYLIETGSNDVLVVKDDKKEHAIPYLFGKVILKVDLEKQEIRVDWELL